MTIKIRNIFNFLVTLLFCISKLSSQNIFTAVGSGTLGSYSGDGGLALVAGISFPQGMAKDASGNIYFCDTGNSCIRKISPSGIITTVVGNGTYGWSGDGGPPTSAQLSAPVSITFDASGNLYIIDIGCHCARKVTSSGTITSIAGIGGPTYSGDGGPAITAGLSSPRGIAVDGSGNVYISDWGNSCIRKINLSGTITTIAGNGFPGYSGDGGVASLAQLNYPYGIAFDVVGNLYITDKTNARIRKIDTSGLITTVAGNGVPGYNGDGIPATSAKISNPEGIKLDVFGNIYFVEAGGILVRKVNTSGIISKVAGIGPPSGYSGDGGPATSAQFYQPNDITFDGAGNLYISDPGNNRIRIICNTNCLAGIGENNIEDKVIIYPNPVSNILHIESEYYFEPGTEIQITNTLGQVVYKTLFKNEVDLTNLPSGLYFLRVSSKEKNYISKFIKE